MKILKLGDFTEKLKIETIIKRPSTILTESLDGATIEHKYFRMLLPWFALASSWGKENRISFNAQYKACPKVNDFANTSSVEITDVDDFMYKLESAIENAEQKLEIDSRTKELIIMLSKYVYDNTDKRTKEMDELKELQIKLAAQ